MGHNGQYGIDLDRDEKQAKKWRKSQEILKDMKRHPNYKDLSPKKNETLVSFTLRCVAMVISPKQIPGESDERECVDIKAAILSMKKEIQRKWEKHISTSKPKR